eukprot:EG_transcript_52683
MIREIQGALWQSVATDSQLWAEVHPRRPLSPQHSSPKHSPAAAIEAHTQRLSASRVRPTMPISSPAEGRPDGVAVMGALPTKKKCRAPSVRTAKGSVQSEASEAFAVVGHTPSSPTRFHAGRRDP